MQASMGRVMGRCTHGMGAPMRAPCRLSQAARLVFHCRTTSASTAPCSSSRMCCPAHCAVYCAPCQPLLLAFSGWIQSPPPTVAVHPPAENNYLTEMCSVFEAGSYLTLIDFVYHSTLGSRVIQKRKKLTTSPQGSGENGSNYHLKRISKSSIWSNPKP